MSANKCCCCRLLSCFACFSDKKTAKPIPSETALSSLNVIANASSAAALTVEEPHVTSAIPPPSNAASGDILGHDYQPSSPSTAASSQASSSKDVLVMQNDPQPIAPSAVPSSSQPTVTSFASPTSSQTIVSPLAHPAHDKGFQLGSSSNPSPSSVLTVESSRAISSFAIAASTPNASHDILGHDSQPSSPSAASSSQANASKYENNSQSIAPSAVPYSSQPTVTSVASPTSSHTIASPTAHPAGSSSAPSSSSVPKDSYHTTNIREAVDAVNIKNVDVDFSDLIDYISKLLDFIEEKKKGNNPSKPKAARYHWPGSKSFFKLRDVLSEGINVVKDVCPDAKTIAQGFLKGMGAAHMATTGLLVVANILERYEAISKNKEACLPLLKEMNKLAQHVTKLQKRPALKGEMEDSIRDAIVLIVEASVACCIQMDASKYSRFFSTTVDGEELAKFKTRLTDSNTNMQRDISLYTVDAIELLRKPREIAYPRYPEDAVGIEKPTQEVIELLEWGSDKNAVAIVLHGFGGLGKTTLADAVFALQFDEKIAGCKYSFIRLFEDIISTPNIIQLQTCILRDLMGEEPKDIRRYEDGQLQIEDMLKKQVVFIYIDNVLLQDDVKHHGDALERLLPKNMRNAKKLRLLITARNKDAKRITEDKGVKTECYAIAIESLPEEEAVKLFKKKLDDNKKQLNPIQVDQICGGVPKLLTVVGGFTCKGNPQKEYRTLMAEDGEELAKFKTRLTETNTHMQRGISLNTVDAIELLLKPREIAYPRYPKDAVGIEKPLQEVIELLEWGSDKNALAIVLHGFGGLGKSTLADAVFARQFDEKIAGCKYSVIKLFENIDSTPNITQLQTCILRDLMGEEPKEIRRYEDGQQEIKDMLEKQEAFIYIDNVLLQDDVKQRGDALEQLLPKNMGNAKKLRLLITARNKDAKRITEYKGVKTECYAIESLPDEEAVKLFNKKLELFNKKLDDKKKPLNPSQVDQIVKICKGVPKILTVVGGLICNEDPQRKYRTLMAEAGRKNWTADSIEPYVFAYDKLDKNLKDPFLDICTFFRGWNWVELSNIVGESQLEKLEERALVTQDVKSKTARVHDVILEIGLDKKGERFRFTSASEIQDFLDEKKDEDLKEIKGICSSDNMDPIYIPASKLDLMYRSLRVLILGDSTDVKGNCKKIFEELVIFSAGVSRFPFDASKLKEFEMLSHIYCKLEDLENLSQMPSNLRHIEFELKSHAFHISSNCIQQLSDLQVLRLKNAHLRTLPQEFGDLVNGLQELTLSNCEYLEELPGSVSRLESLRVLRVESCSRLTQLPKDFGSLNSLQELDLSYCKSLEELPSSLENLTSLQKLDLTWCESLKKLPGSLGKLKLLQELHLFCCTSLEALPSSLEKLSSLRLLDLSCCPIKELPDGLGKLTSLVNLNLYCCDQLSSIPDSIGQLKLHSIELNSSDLIELPDGFCNLSILTELDMTNCIGLEKLPGRFGEVTSLRKLRLACCHGLKKLPESFSQLKSLEHLDLSSSENLEELCIEFKGLSSLRVLLLENCNMLKKLPEDFHSVTSLEVLDLRNCRKLEGKWMDSMVKMKTLQIVRIGGSTLLEERWGEIRGQGDQSLLSAVYTAQGLSNEANILKELSSKFDSMITNGQGKPFHISGLPVNTLLLVMFDGQQEFSNHFPLSLIEENIDDIQTYFEIVYFGNHFDQLPRKVVNRILGHAPANRDAEALFHKVLSLGELRTDNDWLFNNHFQMSAKIVSDEKGDKYLSSWEFFDDEWRVEEFVLKKCGRYLKLKQLIERPRESNIELLRKLFAGGEEEISLGFLKNDASTKVGVDELEGKTILLDIRPANVCRDIPLQSLVDMYVAKERLDFEIITIPIMQENTNMDVSDKFSKEVPWLVLQNPWQLTNATKYFLLEGCPRHPQGWDSWHPNIMRRIESNGTIAAQSSPSVLRMVNTWGGRSLSFYGGKMEGIN